MCKRTQDIERVHSINGVEGRLFNRFPWKETGPLWSTQTWKASRKFKVGNSRRSITVEIRFDDNCKNGHNSFSITGTIRGECGLETASCIHEDIAAQFPELVYLIKWHLMDTTGPMHYIANTIYHAGDRDSSGLRKGETRQLRNGKTGKLAWILEGSSTRYYDGDAPPDESVTVRWKPWSIVGEGKERQLDYARSSAVWPEATDAQLCVEPEALRAALEARLSSLIAAFRADMDAAGLLWEYVP